ncbi:MAG: hypothetical protein AAFZ17_19275 [Cyanobacteria bacterium J06650_10]
MKRLTQSPIWLAALSAIAFSLTTGGVRLWAGSAASRQDDSLALKIAHFEAHKDSYTNVFIGNSRIYRGFNPEIFDQAMAAAGQTSHSYNFGIPAMTEAEITKVVRQISAADPCCLKYVFVELWSPSHLVSVRANRTMASYDPLTAWYALQHTLGSKRAPLEKAVMSAEIVAASGLNVLNVGSLLHTLPEYVPGDTPIGEDSDTYNGYTRLEDESLAEIRRRREKFLAAGEEAFEQLVASQQKAYLNRPALQPYQEDGLTVLEGYLANLNDVELIYVASPFGQTYKVNDPALTVFDYNDVNANRELFEMPLWFDEGHVTSDGAEWLTRDLASRVLALDELN